MDVVSELSVEAGYSPSGSTSPASLPTMGVSSEVLPHSNPASCYWPWTTSRTDPRTCARRGAAASSSA